MTKTSSNLLNQWMDPASKKCGITDSVSSKTLDFSDYLYNFPEDVSSFQGMSKVSQKRANSFFVFKGKAFGFRKRNKV